MVKKKESTQLNINELVPGMKLLVSNYKWDIDNIDISNNCIWWCDLRYFIKKVGSKILCTNNYNNYKKIIDDDIYSDMSLGVKLYNYFTSCPDELAIVDWSIYSIKDIKNNCDEFEAHDIIQIDNKMFSIEDIKDNCNEIEVIEINWKQYNIDDIEDNCSSLD